MKKKQSFHLTVQAASSGRISGGIFFEFFCSFFLLLFSCGSFLLNFSLIFSPGFSLFSSVGLCTVLGISGALLFTARKSHIFPLLFPGIWGLLFLSLFLLRKDFSQQLSSSLHTLETLINAAYSLSFFPGYTDGTEDRWMLCFFLAAFYLLLVLLAMLWKKNGLFVFFLGLPILCSYLLEVSVPVTLFALPFGAFIFWKGLLSPRSVSWLWLAGVPLQGVLFLAAAYLFTPVISPWAFQSSEVLSEYINTAGNRLLFGEGSSGPVLPQTGEGGAGPAAFSYEALTDSQSITSNPPSYTSRNVLSLSIDKEVSQPLYLRGFVGADYRDYQWSPPGDEEWYTYAQGGGFSRQQAGDVYNMPLYGIPVEDLFSLSMEFPSAPAFTYLPLAGNGSSIYQSESNRLSVNASPNISARCFPLTIDTMNEVSMENFDQSSQDILGRYETFCKNRYTTWEEQVPENLLEELDQLPVYLSIPEDPSDQDIRNAAEEIQNFLWDHASYSLSLDSFSPDVPLSQELLYEQKQGFCIHFATVGTQLFRMYGIPARYVSGYFVLPDMLTENSQGNFTGDIPDSRAHAWVEVYTQSAGWIPVEVTPGSQLSAAQTEETNETVPQDMPEEETPPDNTDEENSSIAGREGKNPGVPAALAAAGRSLLIAILALGALVLLLLFVRRLLFLFRLGYFAGGPTQAYLTVFKNLIRLWELEFSVEIQTSSDREYFRLLSDKLPDPLKEEFTALYTEAETFAYGRQKPSPAQLGNLRRYYLRQRKTYIAGKKGLEKLSSLLV